MSVRGAIRNGEWRGSLVGSCRENGRILTADEILDRLCDALAAGEEMLPFQDCDNWDPKNGCMGHEQVENG
jgi:hypothetical protein